MTISKKTKRIVTISLVVGSFVVCAMFAAGFLIPSYLSWKASYDELIKEWNTTSTTTDEVDDQDDVEEDETLNTDTSSKVTVGSTVLTLDETVVRSK